MSENATVEYKPVQFNLCHNDETRALLIRVADRAADLFPTYDRQDLLMDIDAAHSNGCSLDLTKLLSFGDSDFGHDIGGIRRHIIRHTGELEDCFLPRCAMSEREAKKHRAKNLAMAIELLLRSATYEIPNALADIITEVRHRLEGELDEMLPEVTASEFLNIAVTTEYNDYALGVLIEAVEAAEDTSD